jgi:hypothetical protein
MSLHEHECPDREDEVCGKRGFCRCECGATREFVLDLDGAPVSPWVPSEGATTAWGCCGNRTRDGHNPDCPKRRTA